MSIDNIVIFYKKSKKALLFFNVSIYNGFVDYYIKIIIYKFIFNFRKEIDTMKNLICSAIGVVGSTIAGLLGGWDASIITLLIFIVIDYILGIIVAGVFHKSKKSETGSLESRASWKGLCKKGVTILIVVVANRLDLQLGTTYIRDAVCIAFITNETISIVENAGLMGLPIPKVICNALEVLKSKDEKVDQ